MGGGGEEGRKSLFKANAVNEEHPERDRATPAGVCRSRQQRLTLEPFLEDLPTPPALSEPAPAPRRLPIRSKVRNGEALMPATCIIL